MARLNVSLGEVLETRVRQENWEDFLSYWRKVWTMEIYGNVHLDENCRVMFFWNKQVYLSVVMCSDQFIHFNVHTPDGKLLQFYCTFNYAHNFQDKRKEFS